MKKLKEEIIYFLIFLLVVGVIAFGVYLIFYNLFTSMI
jgi:hypothetical protein